MSVFLAKTYIYSNSYVQKNENVTLKKIKLQRICCLQKCILYSTMYSGDWVVLKDQHMCICSTAWTKTNAYFFFFQPCQAFVRDSGGIGVFMFKTEPSDSSLFNSSPWFINSISEACNLVEPQSSSCGHVSAPLCCCCCTSHLQTLPQKKLL